MKTDENRFRQGRDESPCMALACTPIHTNHMPHTKLGPPPESKRAHRKTLRAEATHPEKGVLHFKQLLPLGLQFSWLSNVPTEPCQRSPGKCSRPEEALLAPNSLCWSGAWLSLLSLSHILLRCGGLRLGLKRTRSRFPCSRRLLGSFQK